MSCGKKLGKALVHSRKEPPICDRCADQRQSSGTLRAVAAYADWLASDKARHLKQGVGIALNLRLILEGKQWAVLDGGPE